MNNESKKFLYKLLETPSPTGFEQKIQKIVKNRMKDHADRITVDVHGNLIAALNPTAKTRIMLAGHCDQIGFMVKHISSDGFAYVVPLGGIDVGVLPGTQVIIHGEKEDVPGVIGRKPIHLQKPEERKKTNHEIDNIWIDIGAKDEKDAKKVIAVGDPITFDPSFVEMRMNRLSGPGIDDKAGLFVVMEALRLCKRSKLDVGVYAVSTVQEEIGTRGAITATFGVDPTVGIAVDVCHASDQPGQSDKKVAPSVLGGGPTIFRGPNINPIVEARLISAAKKKKLPYQVVPAARPLGNDARSIQVSRAGVASGAIGIPLRYMHTQVELCELKDLENAAKLLAAFITELSSRTSFIPR